MGPKCPYNPGEDFIKRFTVITISAHLPFYDTVINISDGEYGSGHSAAFTGVANIFLLFAQRVH